MPATIALLYTPAKPGNPFDNAKRAFIAGFARLKVPQIGVTPQPEEIDDIRAFLEGFGRLADAFVATVGAELKANATAHVDLAPWRGAVSDALDFDLTHVVTRIAGELRAEYERAADDLEAAYARAEDERELEACSPP